MPSAVVPTELDRDSKLELGLLRGEVLNHHSSWAALCICLQERPADFGGLLMIVGITHGQVKPFDACADAYSVYEDGCTRAKLKR
jgi:hypothetical protein